MKTMEYRYNRKTGDKISVLGMGSGGISLHGHENGVRVLRKAAEAGINYYDLAAAEGEAFAIFGEAFADKREQVFYQIHFGADYDNGYRETTEGQTASSLVTYNAGDYGKTANADRVQRSVEWQMETLGTDYIDYGFIHCIDSLDSWEEYKQNGLYAMILEYQRQGIVRHIGLSSHTPAVAQAILDEADVDMLMFSINPAYDWHYGDKYGAGTTAERAALYRRCEKEGIGITVMKPYAAGLLLDARKSFFRQAMTPSQCIQYELDTPGVLTVLPGLGSEEELAGLLAYLDAPWGERDYSFIRQMPPEHAEGRCVYCNHCAPCPVGIPVGMVNKCYDLALLGDEMAGAHYDGLSHHASECIACGHCDTVCPFHVRQQVRMQEIAAYFGK